MKTNGLFVASVLTVMNVLFSGCAPVAAPTPTSKPVADPSKLETPAAKPAAAVTAPSITPKPTAEQPRYGGTLERANMEDPGHLDIHQETAVNTHLSVANVYNGLVRYDPIDVGKVIPDLAQGWEASPDAKVFTFHLRQGVRWHDGQPFTSEDAKFSLERMAFWKQYKIISPRGGAMLSAVDKIEARGANTVEVTLKYPSASFLGNAASGWVLMLPKHVIQSKGDMKKDAIGTGPFKWKAWNFGVSQQLVKNSGYFVTGLPYLDGITVYTIKDDATRFAAFRTGRVKMTSMASKGLSHVQAEMVRKEMADKAIAITHAAAVRYVLFMNTGRTPWNDIRVRQAVDLAYDRKAAIAINNNAGIPGAAMHPQGVWGIPEEEMVKRPGYRQPKEGDVAKAKSLLVEAGYPAGFKTRVLVRSGLTTEQQGVVVREQLAKIGIDVAVDVKDTATSQDLLNRHDFDLSSWMMSDPADDPDVTFGGYYTTGSPRNYGEFSDREIDNLFEKQAAILDEKERKKVVVEIQERILALTVYPVIFWDVYNMGFWKEVRGYKPGFGPYGHNNLDHVWLAK